MKNTRPAIIVFCGLLGTGKTTISKRISEKLEIERFSTDEVRRLLGKKVFDIKDTEEVNYYIYERVKKCLDSGKNVILDSAYKTKKARERIYEIGKVKKSPIILIECFCKMETAIKRISSRENKDDLHKPTNKIEDYHEYVSLWESINSDFIEGANEEVSYFKLDTDTMEFKTMKISVPYEKVVVKIRDSIIKVIDSY